MRSELLKCYTGNLDGMRRGLVIARSQKEASEIIGTSLYGFRNFFCRQEDGKWPDQTIKPRTLYTKPINEYIQTPWIEGRCEIKRR